YAFRGAQPQIFLQRLKNASAEAVRVDLTDNWRSRQRILDFVNKVFSRIMTAGIASIDYNKAAMLRSGVDDGFENTGPLVEFHILDEQALDDEGDLENEENAPVDTVTARQRQAGLIARRILELTGQAGNAEQIFDEQSNGYRNARYSDIVILMRSPSNRVNDYVEVFRLAGIPVSCETAAGYFETTEINDMLSLLKVLDNPQRDIEFAAVLRSPVFGITDSQLVKIKLHTSEEKIGFYQRAAAYAENGSDLQLRQRLVEIFNCLDKWRTQARRKSLADLIWDIYRVTNLPAVVSALPNGKTRRANLLKLHERAIQFEGFASARPVPTLHRFVRFIERLNETGRDWSPAEPNPAQDAVRIISVHKAKGLEFPIVFLAELNARFNLSDRSDECLLDEDDGIGLKVIDTNANVKLAGLSHQVIAENRLATSLAEEMRVLYVALTRAKQRLILTACEKHKKCRKDACEGLLFGNGALPQWLTGSVRTPLSWLLLSLADQRELHRVLETDFVSQCGDENICTFRMYLQDSLIGISNYVMGLRNAKRISRKIDTASTDNELLKKVKEQISHKYIFDELTRTPAKTSVSQLTHSGDIYYTTDVSGAFSRLPAEFFSEAKIDSRLTGTAYHLVLSMIDLRNGVDEKTIRETIEKLVSEGAISSAVASELDIRNVLSFFESEIGQEVLNGKNTVYREWSFSCSLGDGNEVVVQGIIDMLVKTPDGWRIIDFKTDRVSESQTAERAERYRMQLGYYEEAVRKVFRTERIEKWIYFLRPGCAVKID
ncbi:MAG: 3'-5' exonuclease, partial [Phycisphaerae bacterium]|nr:3'-5' exonuclease [Phycisphaerae bacterium]